MERVTSATKWLEKMKEMQEVQTALNQQKELSSQRQKDFQRKQSELTRKKVALYQKALQYDSRIKEAISKTRQAESHAELEAKRKRELEALIEQRKQELAARRQEKVQKMDLLRRRSRYQKYLEEEQTEDMPTISAIRQRHQQLSNMNSSLFARVEEYTRRIEDIRTKERALRQEKDTFVLSEYAKEQDLRRQLDSLDQTRRQLQEEIDTEAVILKALRRERSEIKMSLTNLFAECVECRGQQRLVELPGEELERMTKQLHYIRDFMVDLNEVMRARGSLAAEGHNRPGTAPLPFVTAQTEGPESSEMVPSAPISSFSSLGTVAPSSPGTARTAPSPGGPLNIQTTPRRGRGGHTIPRVGGPSDARSVRSSTTSTRSLR